jgi:hypothetical protein
MLLKIAVILWFGTVSIILLSIIHCALATNQLLVPNSPGLFKSARFLFPYIFQIL